MANSRILMLSIYEPQTVNIVGAKAYVRKTLRRVQVQELLGLTPGKSREMVIVILYVDLVVLALLTLVR